MHYMRFERKVLSQRLGTTPWEHSLWCVEGQLHTFWTPALEAGERSASRPVALPSVLTEVDAG
jgi:hypothetical protein